MRRNYTTDDRLQDHPAAEIETVVVDPDAVVELMRRNYREDDPLTSHVFRLVPPFDEEVRAEPYAQDGPKRYPPDQDPEPLHLDPATFVRNDAGVHPNETHLTVPTMDEAAAAAREDHGEDVAESTVEEYHETLLEEWEQDVRDALIPRVRILFEHANGDEIWTDAEYQAAETDDTAEGDEAADADA